MRGRDPVRLLSLVPLLFAVPVLVGIARSALDVAGVAHPFYGDISGTEPDAVAVHLGLPLYHDPATGYSGLVYTPLFAFLWGGLDHLRLWSGWGLLIVLVADLVLIGVVARAAYRPRSDARLERLAAAVGAAGIGALAFWLVSCIPFSFVFQARVDQPAWAAAFAGLLLMPRVASGSRRAAVAAVVLLTVANWFKQSALPADVAAVAWLGCEALARRVTWRMVALFGVALVALNAVPFLIELLFSGRWFWTLVVTMAGARPDSETLGGAAAHLLRSVAPALLVLAGVWAAALLDRWRGAWRWPVSRDGQLAALMAIFLVVDLAPALVIRRAVESADNQFIGIAWALCILVAIGWARARAKAATAAVAAGVVAAAFACTQSNWLRVRAQDHLSVAIRPIGGRARVGDLPPALLRYAHHHTVYHAALSWVDVYAEPRVYPNQANATQLLASGYQPRYLANAFLARHFDAVFLFDESPAAEREAGTGHYEDNYFWKLNEIVRANYARAPRSASALSAAGSLRMYFAFRSPGLYLRRPGPLRAPWMRDCFAPFHVGALHWSIRRGGGFWCRPGGRGGVIRLVRTRAQESELRSEQRGSGLSGEAGVSLAGRNGELGVNLGPWRVRARRDGRSIRLALSGRGLSLATATVPGSRVRLRFARAAPGVLPLRVSRNEVQVAFPSVAPTHVSLWASAASGAAFDLGSLRLVGG